jgi:cytochrome c biogenesis protein CcmG, thiol:disulfide interchange protein DsbE
MNDSIGDATVNSAAGDAVASTRRPRNAPWIALAVAAVLAGLLWVLAGARADDNGSGDDSPRIGQPAPAIVTTTLDGEPFDLSRRKGSWVVLNFFQSSCAPCKLEHPDLVAFVAEESAVSGGAEFYSIIYNDSVDNVQQFFDERGGNWPILRDDDGTFSVALGTAQVPETWVIDPNGVVVRRFAGPVTIDELRAAMRVLRANYVSAING